MISPSHLKKHGVSAAEYKRQFPGSVLRIQSEESRQKISSGKKGTTPWNQGRKTGPNLALSVAKKGKPNLSARGKRLSAEVKGRISAAVINSFSQLSTEQRQQRRKKISEALRQKYEGGYESPLKGTMQSEETKQRISLSVQKSIERRQLAWLQELQTRLEGDFIEVLALNGTAVELECRQCGHLFSFSRQYFSESSKKYHNSRESQLCPSCHPRTTAKSKLEVKVLEWCRETLPGMEVKSGSRSVIPPQELDIWIPEKKLAIEITGLFWHSEQQAKKFGRSKYHLFEKHLECAKQEVRLLTIYEDELIDQEEIVFSRLKNILGVLDEPIYARQLEIRQIQAFVAREFLAKNHIQGADNPQISLGAFKGEELVSVMTFKRTTFVKGGDGSQFELSRFASKVNTRVVGAASRLLSHFQRHHNPDKLDLISYSDNRWSVGGVYERLGFEKVGTSKPGYFYTSLKAGPHQGKRIHRSNFMKHRLERILGRSIDRTKTEYEIMLESGYDRIWDCGTTKWLLQANR